METRTRRDAVNVTVSERDRRAMRKLVAWGARNMREFPWRTCRTPYRVLVAEKLLQQTASRPAVVEAYRRLMTYCPNAARLARADVRKLEKIIRPLGFLYRAKELRRLGRALDARYDGRVPNNLHLLLELPGVGDYTARAVLSFAFGKAVAIVDTNIARFLHRFFGLNWSMPSNPARSKMLLELAAKLLPGRNSRRFNLALLDLCAGICLPQSPRCRICPLRLSCFTGRAALQRSGRRGAGAREKVSG